MSLDPLLPIAPARVKALLLPVGQIRAERFASFVDRLHGEHVVHLKEISADGRPNRSTTSTSPNYHMSLCRAMLTGSFQTCSRHWRTPTAP